MFDYQLDRHCSKTANTDELFEYGSLITSQIDTAPKLMGGMVWTRASLITSQIDTAPKPMWDIVRVGSGLITSQIDTAPKPLKQIPYCDKTFNLTVCVF